MATPWFDHLIVGGGSAGSVLAARLSERGERRVLLIEAGGSDRRLSIRVPGLLERAICNPRLNWNYRGDPDPSLDSRALTWAAGRVIGGSSSINGLVCARGLPADYDRWVAAGHPRWSWSELMPYFRRLERWAGLPHPDRGDAGPLRVRRFEETHEACRATLDALVAHGVPFVEDYNLGIVEGASLTQVTQRNGRRHSAADAYLHPARRRANLFRMTHARALTLIFAGGRCTGVRIERHGKLIDLHAAREVILCAGAIGTPALLLRSGIGPAAALQAVGIRVKQELPGVGEHLNEHVNVRLCAFVECPTYNTARGGLRALRHGVRWAVCGAGPASSPANHCQAFVRTDRSLADADVQIQLMPYGLGTPEQMRCNGMTAVVSLCRPAARGRVRLDSAEPTAAPRIGMALLASAADRAALLRGCRLAQRALRDGPGRYLGARLYAPELGTLRGELSDEAWQAFFRSTAGLNWHPTSTCRMGMGPDDVVDHELKVHGVENLRIADAAIMPSVTSSNTNIPVMAIAERAAEMIMAHAS